MANRWGDSGNSDRLYFGAPKSLQMVTTAMKLTLAPWKKSYDQPRQHIKKQTRDITLATEVCLVKAMVSLVVMCGCESWTIKIAECRRIHPFKLCWRRLLRVLWTARRSNQSILKDISPEYSLEALMLKLQYFGYLRQIDSFVQTLMLGKTEDRRRG